MILLIFVSILLISMKKTFLLRILHFANNWLLWSSMWNVVPRIYSSCLKSLTNLKSLIIVPTMPIRLSPKTTFDSRFDRRYWLKSHFKVCRGLMLELRCLPILGCTRGAWE